MFDGNYPPGVTGRMIDDYFADLDEAIPPRSCENCRFYFNGTCDLADGDLSAEEIEAMPAEEYTALVERKPDDCCEEHEFWED